MHPSSVAAVVAVAVAQAAGRTIEISIAAGGAFARLVPAAAVAAVTAPHGSTTRQRRPLKGPAAVE